MAPFGYDLVTVLYHTYTFPPKGVAEYERGYAFANEQEARYLEEMDNLTLAAGI